MVVHESQLKILGNKSFETWLARHVRCFFPEFAARHSKASLREWIRRNRTAAGEYFQTEPGVSLYIDLACLFGDHFAADPRLPWASEILNSRTLNESRRRRELYNRARAHLLGPIPQGRIRRSA